MGLGVPSGPSRFLGATLCVGPGWAVSAGDPQSTSSSSGLSGIPTNLIQDHLFFYKEWTWLLTRLESLALTDPFSLPQHPFFPGMNRNPLNQGGFSGVLPFP